MKILFRKIWPFTDLESMVQEARDETNDGTGLSFSVKQHVKSSYDPDVPLHPTTTKLKIVVDCPELGLKVVEKATYEDFAVPVIPDPDAQSALAWFRDRYDEIVGRIAAELPKAELVYEENRVKQAA